eukprot:m.1444349 g.1444349  ORF g.1444349 m.1444349 type:complete len:296 (-) comp25104_c0_seq21:67-954(-)
MKTTVDAQDLEREFGNRVIAIGQIWPFLDSYEAPSYTTRLWCLFELFTAMKKRCTIEVLFSLNERTRLFRAIRAPGGYAGITTAWKVDSANAKASVDKDRDFIREIIQKNVFGGFSELDLRITEAFKILLDALGVCRSRASAGYVELGTLSRPRTAASARLSGQVDVVQESKSARIPTPTCCESDSSDAEFTDGVHRPSYSSGRRSTAALMNEVDCTPLRPTSSGTPLHKVDMRQLTWPRELSSRTTSAASEVRPRTRSTQQTGRIATSVSTVGAIVPHCIVNMCVNIYREASGS